MFETANTSFDRLFLFYKAHENFGRTPTPDTHVILSQTIIKPSFHFFILYKLVSIPSIQYLGDYDSFTNMKR